MRFLTRAFLFARSLSRKGHVEQELDEELRYHVERQTEENMRTGMTEAEARIAALREFGGVAQIQEECRDERTSRRLETLARDLRYGWRGLRRNPQFTAAAVVILALGIGANSAIFTVLYEAVLKPLPYADAERLMSLRASVDLPNRGQVSLGWSYPKLIDLRTLTTAFESLAAYSPAAMNLTGAGDPERVEGEIVTGNYFDTLRV